MSKNIYYLSVKTTYVIHLQRKTFTLAVVRWILSCDFENCQKRLPGDWQNHRVPSVLFINREKSPGGFFEFPV